MWVWAPCWSGTTETNALPPLSTATHSEVDGQEIPFSWVVAPPLSIASGVHGVALAGAVLEYTWPWLSVAKQSVVDGHEIAVKEWPESISTGVLQALVAGEVL